MQKRGSIEFLFFFFVKTAELGHFESGFKLIHALWTALRLFEHMFSISIVYMAVGLCWVTKFMLTEDWL